MGMGVAVLSECDSSDSESEYDRFGESDPDAVINASPAHVAVDNPDNHRRKIQRRHEECSFLHNLLKYAICNLKWALRVVHTKRDTEGLAGALAELSWHRQMFESLGGKHEYVDECLDEILIPTLQAVRDGKCVLLPRGTTVAARTDDDGLVFAKVEAVHPSRGWCTVRFSNGKVAMLHKGRVEAP